MRCAAALASVSPRARTGATPREHLVEHDAEREDVAPRVHRLAEDLLGLHVRGRPERRVGLGSAARRRAASPRSGASGAMPKSTSLTSPRSTTSTLRRLHVAVDDPAIVRVLEPARDRRADGRRGLGRSVGASCRGRRQAEPVDVLEDEPHLRLRLHEVVEHHDVRVAEHRQDARLRSSCAAKGDVGEIVLFSALTATTRPSGSCTARYTVESEPDPSSSRTRYGPKARLAHGPVQGASARSSPRAGDAEELEHRGATSQMRPPGAMLGAAVGVVHVEERDAGSSYAPCAAALSQGPSSARSFRDLP